MLPTHSATIACTPHRDRRRSPRLMAGLLGMAAALGAWGPPAAWAASSASWASSEGASASVGSLSASVRSISDSSTAEARLAPGTYRVVELATVPGRVGFLGLRLARLGADGSAQAEAHASTSQPPAQAQLVLPEHTVRAAAILAGDSIHVRELPQGLEFAHGTPVRTFFLALREDGFGDLRTRALAL